MAELQLTCLKVQSDEPYLLRRSCRGDVPLLVTTPSCNSGFGCLLPNESAGRECSWRIIKGKVGYLCLQIVAIYRDYILNRVAIPAPLNNPLKGTSAEGAWVEFHNHAFRSPSLSARHHYTNGFEKRAIAG